jgi:hypothetical protein
MDDSTEQTAQPSNDSIEDFTTDYANNTTLEATIWDLKLIFGEFSQRAKGVEWHTSITVPWAQAKLLNHYLEVNVKAHELEFGTIKIPKVMLPPEVPAPSDPTDKKAQAQFEMLRDSRQRFIESLE